jgi:hypothetical protein
LDCCVQKQLKNVLFNMSHVSAYVNLKFCYLPVTSVSNFGVQFLISSICFWSPSEICQHAQTQSLLLLDIFLVWDLKYLFSLVFLWINIEIVFWKKAWNFCHPDPIISEKGKTLFWNTQYWLCSHNLKSSGKVSQHLTNLAAVQYE